MPFIKDMTNAGWKLSYSSFGFSTPRRYNSILNNHGDDFIGELFSDFHYNLWWKGRANILLRHSSDFAVNIKMNGEVFAFAEDLNSVSIETFFY